MQVNRVKTTLVRTVTMMAALLVNQGCKPDQQAHSLVTGAAQEHWPMTEAEARAHPEDNAAYQIYRSFGRNPNLQERVQLGLSLKAATEADVNSIPDGRRGRCSTPRDCEHRTALNPWGIRGTTQVTLSERAIAHICSGPSGQLVVGAGRVIRIESDAAVLPTATDAALSAPVDSGSRDVILEPAPTPAVVDSGVSRLRPPRPRRDAGISHCIPIPGIRTCP
ncbi:hypothetical protein HZB07_03900 [Candidatus Saganbacteria bacterium]|nr:hypothetical protein [Candidatus Saganbacteria bacterium]